MMKKTLIVLIAILIAFLVSVEAKPESLKKSFVPADVDWMIHVDVDKFKTTRLHSYLMENEKISKVKQLNAEVGEKLKVDFFNDIAGVTVFGKGEGEENAVVCINGKFDRAHILGLLEAEGKYKEIKHGNFTIYNWDKDEFGTFASGDLILLSPNGEAIKNALDVISGKKESVASSSRFAELADIPSDAYLSATVNDLASKLMGSDKPVMLKKIKSAVVSARESNDNFAFNIAVTAAAPEDAEKMEQAINGILALVSLQMAEKETELNFAESLKVMRSGNKIQIELSMPNKDLFDVMLGKKDISHIFKLHDLPPFS
jgi:hypothetical protein